jgi:hypothetical protein
MTQIELETALDAGNLEVRMSHGRWWKARRNGQTRTNKMMPGTFAIPCKIGFNSFMTLTQIDTAKEPSDLRVV